MSYHVPVAGTRQAPDRSRQKARTHTAIVDAAAQTLREGRQPTVAEAADVAGVHRATAYRYFPTQDSLLAEAALTVGTPDAEAVFGGIDPDDPIALVEAAVRAIAAYSFREEALFRTVVRVTIDSWFAAQVENQPRAIASIRETRRFRFIDHALRPLADRLAPDALRRLRYALALTFGAEAVIVTRDVCRLNPEDATDLMAWTATTLVRAAIEEELPRTTTPRTTRRTHPGGRLTTPGGDDIHAPALAPFAEATEHDRLTSSPVPGA